MVAGVERREPPERDHPGGLVRLGRTRPQTRRAPRVFTRTHLLRPDGLVPSDL